jgi:flagellar biosynthesis protein FlhF
MKAREPDKRHPSVIAFDTAYRKKLEPQSERNAKNFSRADLFAMLALHRVPEPLAHALADDAARSGHEEIARALAEALEKRMTAKPINYMHATAILLKGVNGSGKTTVSTKIAAQAHLAGRRVKVLASDSGARALVALAERIDIKLASMPNAQSVSRTVAQAKSRNALVVIDTAGFNPRKAKARAAFSALGQIENTETMGVVSALGDAVEAGEIIAALNVERIIVTGLDLTRRWGTVAVAATCGVPLAHVARSAFAGDGLEPLTPIALAQTLLGVKPNLQ